MRDERLRGGAVENPGVLSPRPARRVELPPVVRLRVAHAGVAGDHLLLREQADSPLGTTVVSRDTRDVYAVRPRRDGCHGDDGAGGWTGRLGDTRRAADGDARIRAAHPDGA